MKTGAILFTTILVLGLKASAETSYARTCRIAGGQHWVLDEVSQSDTILCVFREAAVGAAEFAHYKWGQGLAKSLKAFLHQHTHLNVQQGVCEAVGAAHRIAKDSQGAYWEFCKFDDGSMIEAKTLAAGVNGPANLALVQALH